MLKKETEYDALNNGQVFTISEMCAKTENGYIPVNDGARICYANTAVKDNSDKSELLQLFLEKDSFDNPHFPKLSNKVRYFKNTEKGRVEMCQIVEEYAKEYAKDAIRETIINIAIAMLKKGEDVEDISEYTGLSHDEILEIQEKMNL